MKDSRNLRDRGDVAEAIMGADELLFRAIKRSKPECVVDGKVTSALFKEKVGVGVSVDREADRDLDEVISYMLNGSLKGRVKAIGSFKSKVCGGIGVRTQISPSLNNPYHVDIWLEQHDEDRNNLQAWVLARACKVVYEDPKMEWTA